MSGTGMALLGMYSLLLVTAALQDLRSLRISNSLSVAVLAVAIAQAILAPGERPAWEHLASFGLILGAGMLLFRLGWFGGGDAKLFAAAAAWFDLAHLMPFVATVLMGGALVTLLLLGGRTIAGSVRGGEVKWLGLRRGRSIPYGVAIAGGAIAVAWLNPPMPIFAG